MKPLRRFLCYSLLALAVRAEDAPAEPAWLDNFSAAAAEAKQQGRFMLLDFTGSDWCVWCHRLHDEVFSKPAFATYAKESLVLVEVDFPRKKELPPALTRQNRDLAERYGVTGYPTIILLGPDGALAGKLSYMEGGAKTFVRELRRLTAAANRR